MSDTKLKIILKGLAFCRIAPVPLEALFLYTQAHELKLRVCKNKVWEPERHIPRRCKMSIELVGARAVPGRGIDDDCRRIIDFNYHLHETQIKLKENQHHLLSYLSVQNAFCYTDRQSDKDHEFWKVDKDTGETTRKYIEGDRQRKIGLDIGADFTIQPGGKLLLNIEGAFNYVRQFPQADDVAEYQIIFDNSCPYRLCGNDFVDYYQIIEERGKNIIFEEKPIPPSPQLEHEVTKGDSEDFNDEAACNVTKGDPRCDMLRYYTTGSCN